MTTDDDPVFALLDDCGATAARRSSRLYTGFSHERVCARPFELDAVNAAVSDDLRAGLHAVVVADYGFGRLLVLGESASSETQRGDAALRFLLFERCERLSADEVSAWLAQCDHASETPGVAGTANLVASVDESQFADAISRIHDALRAGDSYQVNYTYRLGFDVFGEPVAFYRRLRASQPVPYGALIALPGDEWLLSCSPELFVEKSGAMLRARPMKGTAPRASNAEDDRAAAAHLQADAKNRAENVMIVDLLRNDISRVAATGSVKVPALFSVEPYASVWQMTSSIEATLRPGTSFADLMRALFPCGSITGAPKHSTMQLIDALESTPRGVYTGAIGWLDATSADDDTNATCGDFCLSVAIRTLMVSPADTTTGQRRGTMGVGAGIVLDSVAADEFAECRLKARFLTDADPGFQLFETMHATRDEGVRYVERHLARLSASANKLGFACELASIQAKIDEACGALPANAPHRMRAALDKAGKLTLTTAALTPLAPEATVGVLIGPKHGFSPTHANDPLLLHKTTRRADYDRGWREAEARGGFDTLFFNDRGELTEGGRTNVFVKLDGRWWTPPLSSGALPGVMRAVLLDDPRLAAAERVLTLDDLQHAEALIVCNALHGALNATIVD